MVLECVGGGFSGLKPLGTSGPENTLENIFLHLFQGDEFYVLPGPRLSLAVQGQQKLDLRAVERFFKKKPIFIQIQVTVILAPHHLRNPTHKNNGHGGRGQREREKSVTSPPLSFRNVITQITI